MKLSNIQKNRGQGMSEYLVIVALIAVVSIASIGFFGNSARTMFGAVGQALSGNDGGTAAARVAAQGSALAIQTEEGTLKGMDDFDTINN